MHCSIHRRKECFEHCDTATYIVGRGAPSGATFIVGRSAPSGATLIVGRSALSTVTSLGFTCGKVPLGLVEGGTWGRRTLEIGFGAEVSSEGEASERRCPRRERPWSERRGSGLGAEVSSE